MRFDTWTKQQRQALDVDYQKRFGGQVRVMKKLYQTKNDPILLDELLDNVASITYQTLIFGTHKQTEALIERMYLSVLEYDVFIEHDYPLDTYSASLVFFNDYDTVEYTDIALRTPYDVKKFLEMILYMNQTYLRYLNIDPEIELHLGMYDLLEGFDVVVKSFDEDDIQIKTYQH